MKIVLGIILILVIVISIKFFNSDTSRAEKISSPRYTWAAFSSFWNKQAMTSIKIKKDRKTDIGYFVEFKAGNTMRVSQKGSIITAACVNYIARDDYEGGVIFTRLKNRMINIGTFRWPQDRITEVAQLFEIIGKTEKYYSHKASTFRLTHSEALGWTFCLEFAQ